MPRGRMTPRSNSNNCCSLHLVPPLHESVVGRTGGGPVPDRIDGPTGNPVNLALPALDDLSILRLAQATPASKIGVPIECPYARREGWRVCDPLRPFAVAPCPMVVDIRPPGSGVAKDAGLEPRLIGERRRTRLNVLASSD